MSSNTFGTLFRFTTFGESHGPALGCVVDGCAWANEALVKSTAPTAMRWNMSRPV